MDALPVLESSQIGNARRSAIALSRRIGFSQTRIAEAGIIATELATNLVKHGGGGQLLIGGYDDETGNGLEFLSLDKAWARNGASGPAGGQASRPIGDPAGPLGRPVGGVPRGSGLR
jgi:hypothetical protein